MQYIITYLPELKKQAYAEIEKTGGLIKKALAPNLTLADLQTDRLAKSNPVFVRHIMPVNITGYVQKNKHLALDYILNRVQEITTLNSNDEFSVQCRIIEGGSYTAKDVEVYIGGYFDEAGAKPVFSDYTLASGDDVFVISILIHENELYCGFSKAFENLNFHSDEYRVLSRNGGREISRAENKLKEAIHKFKINITGKGFALDVGASPGGWSKVLAEYGFTVFAVDPGDLHPSLLKNPAIRHFKSKIQDTSFNEKFELVVNDMNIEPQYTADIMNLLSHNLAGGANAIVTLKLPFSDIGRSINESIEILSQNYELKQLKNLTHNRREVTALLCKKPV